MIECHWAMSDLCEISIITTVLCRLWCGNIPMYNLNKIQLNLSITVTLGTEKSGRCREVSVYYILICFQYLGFHLSLVYEKFPQSWRVASTFWSTTWDRKWFYSGKLCTSLSGDVIYISTLDSGHVVSFQISSKHCTKITKDCLWAWQAGWSSYPRPLLRVLFLLENIYYPTSPARVFFVLNHSIIPLEIPV